MIKLRKHPDDTWTAPYVDQFLNEEEFKKIGKLDLLEEVNDGTILFTDGEMVLRVIACAPGIIRLTLSPDGIMPPDSLYEDRNGPYGIIRYSWPPCKCRTAPGKKKFEFHTGLLSVAVELDPFRLSVRDPNNEKLLSTLLRGFGFKKSNAGYETLSFFEKDGEDRIFGFGGRIHKPERTGSTADLFAVKVRTERGDYGGFPLPYFLNTRGYGFLLDNPWPHVYFDMGREFEDRWFLHTPGGFLDFYVLAGPDFADIAKRYCRLTGYPALPPPWMFGFWFSTFGYDKMEQFQETAGRLREEGWPFDVMVADLQWRGGGLARELEGIGGCNLEWDEKFGDGRQLIKYLHDRDARLCLHLNTAMYAREQLEQGLSSGALRRVQKGVVVPRVTDPQGEEWFWETMKPRVEEGTDSWWTDNGERVDGTLACGLPSRNLFGQIWNKVIFERMKEATGEDRLVLSRSGWLGAQKFTLTWPGDTGPGVDRLLDDLWWHLNCSVSGIPYNTADFGGFFTHSRRYFPDNKEEWYENVMHSSENIIRRVANAMLLFTVPRVHGPAKLPWMYPERVQRIWRFFLELRYRLFPYLYSLVIHCAKTGEPVFRPLVWHHRKDEAAIETNDEIYLGKDLLLAPVVREGALEREVYLPTGNWIDFWSGEEHRGGRRIVADAPFFEPKGLPIFVRKGALIPMRQLRQFNGGEPEPEFMLHLFPAREGEQTIREGPTRSFQVSYRLSDATLEIIVENPLDCERKVHLVPHLVSVREGKIDRNAAFPFPDRRVLTATLEPRAEKQVVFTLE